MTLKRRIYRLERNAGQAGEDLTTLTDEELARRIHDLASELEQSGPLPPNLAVQLEAFRSSP